jgi:hypothetical protein
MIFPLMSRRHSGVEVVPQLLLSELPRNESYEQSCPDIEAERDSAMVVIVMGAGHTQRQRGEIFSVELVLLLRYPE